MAEQNPAAGRTRLRTMIIDDEPIVCKRLKSALQKVGYAVETFTDSTSALARLKEATFDIVITDLKMEGADGLQVLMRAKELSPRTRVIVITGFATMETARESFHKGAFDFVAKPFKLGDILECVRRIEEDLRRVGGSPPPQGSAV